MARAKTLLQNGGYLPFRLLVEYLKPTPAPTSWGLTAIQWACVVGLGYYIWR